MRRIRTFTSSSSNATITPQKGMTILKNVSIKSHLSILRVPRGKNAQYQYVKDLPTLHKGIRQGLYVFFGPLVSEAVCHFAKCSSWLRFTHHLGDYGIIPCQVVAGTGGFEPPTSRLTVWRSNQLKLCPQHKKGTAQRSSPLTTPLIGSHSLWGCLRLILLLRYVFFTGSGVLCSRRTTV